MRSLDGILRLMSFLRFAADEEIHVLILDGQSKLIGVHLCSRGGRHEVGLDPASLFRTALLAEAHAVIVVHNHPSGSVRPSSEDIRTTELVLFAGFALGLPVLDHVIIGAKDAYSFANSGMLGFLHARQLKALGIEGIPEVRHPEERANEAKVAIANLARKRDEGVAAKVAVGEAGAACCVDRQETDPREEAA